MSKRGLVVHTIALEEEKERFLDSYNSLGKVLNSYTLKVVTEDDYKDYDLDHLNVARAKNIGIRELLGKGVDGVVCIDADYIIPPGLLELFLEDCVQDFHIWVRRRDCTLEESKKKAWGKWVHLPVFTDCWGSCNYMSKKNWLLTGGWDERTEGWGGDDDILHIRAGQKSIERRRIDAYPLMHIKHERRAWSVVGVNSEGNMKFANQEQPNYLMET